MVIKQDPAGLASANHTPAPAGFKITGMTNRTRHSKGVNVEIAW